VSKVEFNDEQREKVRAARRLVVFSGAGTSKESGLDTFRGAGGLWERMRPEELATPEAFHAQPETVWRWYAWRYGRLAAVLPNPAHHAIARLESVFPFCRVVTQNVDGLHQRAGSRNLLELHGSLALAFCTRCRRERPMAEAVAESEADPRANPPRCACGGLFRPGVVWFGEMLPEAVLREAIAETESCDVFLSVGTSALVYPAAGLIELAHRSGALVIEVNPEPTPLSRLAHLRFAAAAGECLPRLAAAFAAVREARA
jgi:NAD-dependent deacetylase